MNETNDESNVVAFKPKKIKENDTKYFGSVSVDKSGKVKVDMDDKTMLLNPSIAMDLGIVLIIAAKFLLTRQNTIEEGK